MRRKKECFRDLLRGWCFGGGQPMGRRLELKEGERKKLRKSLLKKG